MTYTWTAINALALVCANAIPKGGIHVQTPFFRVQLLFNSEKISKKRRGTLLFVSDRPDPFIHQDCVRKKKEIEQNPPQHQNVST